MVAKDIGASVGLKTTEHVSIAREGDWVVEPTVSILK